MIGCGKMGDGVVKDASPISAFGSGWTVVLLGLGIQEGSRFGRSGNRTEVMSSLLIR